MYEDLEPVDWWVWHSNVRDKSILAHSSRVIDDIILASIRLSVIGMVGCDSEVQASYAHTRYCCSATFAAFDWLDSEVDDSSESSAGSSESESSRSIRSTRK